MPNFALVYRIKSFLKVYMCLTLLRFCASAFEIPMYFSFFRLLEITHNKLPAKKTNTQEGTFMIGSKCQEQISGRPQKLVIQFRTCQ